MSINGNEDIESEELLALELGYRLQARENLNLDLALFLNKYRNLQVYRPVDFREFPNPVSPLGPPIRVPTEIIYDNGQEATSRGLELSIDWRPHETWRLQASYSYIDVSVDSASAGEDPSKAVAEGSGPKHQLSVRSISDLSRNWSLDFSVYYVDELAATSFSHPQPIADYTSLNARLAWRPGQTVELSLVGKNLLDDRHTEFIGENYVIPTEIERSIVGQVRWEF
jgi:iron complex outermembrane receptor protein